MHISKNSQLVYRGANSRVEACISSPTFPPYVGKQLMVLFHTDLPFSSLRCWSVCTHNDILFNSKHVHGPKAAYY